MPPDSALIANYTVPDFGLKMLHIVAHCDIVGHVWHMAFFGDFAELWHLSSINQFWGVMGEPPDQNEKETERKEIATIWAALH